MQIDFTPTKIKNAGVYVDRLSPQKKQRIAPIKKKPLLFIKELFQFLFK